MSAITELATRLGKAIADSPEAAALREARETFNADEALKKLLEEFEAQSEKVARLQEQNQPIEVDDKHRLSELEDKLAASEVFKKLTAAQVEYIDLMRKVQTTLRAELGDVEGQ